MSFDILIPKSVNISAQINENEVTIFGYTSPFAKVELENYQVYSQTYSDSTGYFKFNRTLLPKNPPDLCLSATDLDNRHTVPVCIPPPPSTQYHTDIGPIILPPSLTLDSATISTHSDTALASGQSLPNAPITIHFYQTQTNAPLLPLPASAFSLPRLTLNTDTQGHFSFSLPTIYSSRYRFFATTTDSPKSTTLNYRLPGFFYLYYLSYLFIFLLAIILFFFFKRRRKTNRTPLLPSVPFLFLPSLPLKNTGR
jgi:hypothetical protein